MSIRTYRDLLEAVKTLPPLPVAVAGGADPRVIDSLKKAREMGSWADATWRVPGTP